MKKTIAEAVVCASIAVFGLAGCDKPADGQKDSEAAEDVLDAKGAELHIYTWADYIDPSIIESFEKLHDCHVIVDTFDSNESMYATLKTGMVGYDIATPSSYFVSLLANEGLIQKLDHTKLPNVKVNFDPSFAGQILDPSFTYNVPYAVTYTGFCYAKKHIPANVDVATWAVLSNETFKGRITMLDDIRETIGAGLMSLGYSINSVDPDEISEAVDVVLSWRKNIRKLDAESYKMEVASGTTWIGHGYSTDSMQIIIGDEEEEMPPRPDIGFALPKEGFSIAFDEMVLCTGAPQPELAYAFMNHLYEGPVAKANMEYILGPTPVKPGIEALDEELRSHIILPPEVMAKGQVIDSLDSVPGIMELYNKGWEKIKASMPIK